MTDAVQAIEWIRDVGALGVVILALVGFLRGWIVTRREFDALRAEKEWWRDTAMRALTIGEAAVGERRDHGTE